MSDAIVEKFKDVDLKQEIKQDYLDYAVSVITDRALPDVRDGLKPVQRRVLYAMNGLGVSSGSAYKKSARIVGEAMGKYHPHGDSAIYSTMARMAQDFIMGLTLTDGQGNFGSIDGDKPAAMRYTEIRLSKAGEDMMRNLEEDTVDWQPNFDGSLKEPKTLPARIPNLLINGAAGVAVGMATKMPPYNVTEAIDACILRLTKPKCSISDLMNVMPGPDFPTGGIIINTEDEIKELYATGRGKLVIRGVCEVEPRSKGGNNIIIKSVPYTTDKYKLTASIADFIKNGYTDITDMRDESDRHGIRIVIETVRGSDTDTIINDLYRKTLLETSFSAISIALYDGKVFEYGALQLIDVFLDYRRETVRRRAAFRLKKAQDRLHIVEGLLKAQASIDKIIKLIRQSASPASAASELMAAYSLTAVQAQAILDMKLQRLTGLEKSKLEKEKADLNIHIQTCQAVLSNPKVLDKVIKKELQECKDQYGKPRMTKICSQPAQ